VAEFKKAQENIARSMPDLFISYSRKDKDFVRRLDESLKSRGREAWVDWEDIRPTEDFMQAIYGAIEGVDTFVFVLTPDSVASVVCGREIAHAAAHNKRMVPIVARDVNADTVHEALAKLNWIFCRENDDFEKAADTLISAFDTDLEWVHAHTRLLTRAIEWENKGKNNSFVLRGDDLRSAEQWLAEAGAQKERQPTALQTEYIIASRKAAARRQRITLGAVSVSLVITVALAVLAWFKRNEAVSQANIALARQLAAQAEVIRSERPDLLQRSVLLAVESLKRYPTLEADQLLRQGLPLLPRAVGRPMKHHGPVQAVAFSPNGTHLATASWDGTAGVWEAATGRQIFTMTPGQVNNRVSAVAFSPTGKLIATADFPGTAQVWDATNGLPIGQRMEPRTGHPVEAVAFSGDGSYLATVTEGGADVWDVNANGKVSSTPVFSTSALDETFPCAPLSSFVFSPGGKHAAAACRGQVIIWDISTWKAVVTIPYKIRPGLRPPLHPIAFSADGKYLASADEVYEVATGTLAHALYSQWPVSTVTFSHDGDYIALAAGDIVRLVNASDGVSFAELHHARKIRDIAISPSGHEVATASDDNTARIWQVNRYEGEGPTREVTRISHEDKVSSIDFSPDGKYLTTASEDGTVGVWQVNSEQGAAHQVYGGTDGPVVAVSSTGKFLAVENADSVQVREAADGREVGRVVYADNSESNVEVAQASLSQDGRYLWMTARQRRRRRGRGALPEIQKIARVWDASRGEEVARIKYEDTPGAAVFSPDAKHLAADDGTTLRVWEVTVTGSREVTRIKYEPAHAAPVFSPDGAHLAIIEPKAIRILETNGWREVRSLPIAERTFRDVVFSPNGKYLAGGSIENVHIWEVTGGQTNKSLPVKYATAILFSPDGKHIVTANWNFYDPSDRSVRIWDTEHLREVGRLQLLEIERADNVDGSQTQLAFTKDGRYLAMENQGTLRIWDMSTRRETERWESGYATQLGFSPDGKYLFSGHGTTASVWLWGPEAMIAKACNRLGRNLNPEEWRQYLGDEPYRKTCPNKQ
jgi:WD40 repeat protein